MQAIETTASFNDAGELIINNLPAIRNRKVKLLILLEEEQTDWHQLSAMHLSTAYGADEPDYETGTVKEPNPDYKP